MLVRRPKTGDGGEGAVFEKSISQKTNEDGIAVVGLISRGRLQSTPTKTRCWGRRVSRQSPDDKCSNLSNVCFDSRRGNRAENQDFPPFD